jgi:hypothetical protein
MKPWMRVVGGLGLSIDVAFHWSEAESPGSPGSVLRTLFVDADPGSVWWVMALGVVAHVMFFGVFVLMLSSRAGVPRAELKESTRSRAPRDERASATRRQTKPEDVERRLQEHLGALGPEPRAELLQVLMLPDGERAERLDGYYGDKHTRTLAQLLLELEELPQARAAVLGELRVR